MLHKKDFVFFCRVYCASDPGMSLIQKVKVNVEFVYKIAEFVYKMAKGN